MGGGWQSPSRRGASPHMARSLEKGKKQKKKKKKKNKRYRKNASMGALRRGKSRKGKTRSRVRDGDDEVPLQTDDRPP